MAYYNADQPYYDGTYGWGLDILKPGWSSWISGGDRGATLYFMNKVWDPFGSGQWVLWETTHDPDPAGASYPDPYGSGFGACTFYRVQGMRYV